MNKLLQIILCLCVNAQIVNGIERWQDALYKDSAFFLHRYIDSEVLLTVLVYAHGVVHLILC